MQKNPDEIDPNLSLCPVAQEVYSSAMPFQDDILAQDLGVTPDTVLDIGGNQGESILRFMRLWPSCHIVSFEPRASAYARLLEAAEPYGDQVLCYNIGLGDASFQTSMYEFPENPGGSSALAPTPHLIASRTWAKQSRMVEAEIRPLDSVIKIPDGCRLFIKVDVQGYTIPVIRGGREAFSRALAALIEYSVEDSYEGAATKQEISSELLDCGLIYRRDTRRVTREGLLLWADGLWAR